MYHTESGETKLVKESVDIGRNWVNCVFLHKQARMENSTTLPADGVAERIVRHFQAEGFTGIAEALILRIGLRKGDQLEAEAAFQLAREQQKAPPVGEYFDIRPYGHFSAFRSFAEARAAIHADFSHDLRCELPNIYFEAAPLIVHDALATSTKYDLMLKLSANVDGCAFAVLLNDPDSSLFEYLGSHQGDEWQQIMGDFSNTAAAIAGTIELL